MAGSRWGYARKARWDRTAGAAVSQSYYHCTAHVIRWCRLRQLIDERIDSFPQVYDVGFQAKRGDLHEGFSRVRCLLLEAALCLSIVPPEADLAGRGAVR